jgi:hypothetical protein
MTTEEWAKNEVAIAMNKERKAANKDKDEGIGLGYANSCYQSALKAYHSMCEDGHSGMSWSITANILTRLLREAPLTPIEEDEDCWSNKNSLDGIQEQCIRRFSLFRIKQPDGTYKYHDIDLVCTCYAKKDHFCTCSSRKGDLIAEKFFGPLIKFPYYPPTDRYQVRMIEFDNLCDERGNEICFVISAKSPYGETKQIMDFYAFTAQDAKKLKAADVEPKLSISDQKEMAEKLAFSNSQT